LRAIGGSGSQWSLAEVLGFLQTALYETGRTEQAHQIVSSKGGLNIVVFMIDSNIRMFPCQGRVNQETRTWLSDLFESGRKGRLRKRDGLLLTDGEYADALKILLLHHTPLERDDYHGALSKSE